VLLDDHQIERYSRQIVLAEVGAEGQIRLLAARVAVRGGGAAAARIVGYLAAAGVGTISAPAALHAAADGDQTDVRLALPGGGDDAAGFDVVAATADDAAGVDPAAWSLGARHRFWIADGRAAAAPPCPACARLALGEPAPVAPELAALRDALLGTVVATEVVKALLAIGTPLAGRVLSYEPSDARIVVSATPSRPGCGACAAAAREV
jgi:adenylyltransferase/sulfurtransferase